MDNGKMPAMPFEIVDEVQSSRWWSGLTKREMMAMHVMASIATTVGYQNYGQMAQDAIAATDALLDELEKSQ